jgi:hypothetical protein
VPDDSKKSKWELLEEVFEIVTFIDRPECLRRMRALITRSEEPSPCW